MLGLQLCRMVTSYFESHTPTSQIESLKYDCPRLHRIWVPNTMEPRGKKKKGFEIIVFGQILPHKIGVSDLRSPNSQIQFLYTPNTMPIKDGLRKNKVKIPSVKLNTEQDVRFKSLQRYLSRDQGRRKIMPLLCIGPVVARRKRGNALAISLKKIDN